MRLLIPASSLVVSMVTVGSSIQMSAMWISSPNVEAFRPISANTRIGLHSLSNSGRDGNFPLWATEEEQLSSSPCDVVQGNEQRIASTTAQSLRSARVVNINGDRVMLGDQMKQGTSIVVFLRHLG
jgi:hypothetical protein